MTPEMLVDQINWYFLLNQVVMCLISAAGFGIVALVLICFWRHIRSRRINP